jgi:hypothetical protein
MSKLSKSEIEDLDKWIEQLKECQPLEECQVKILCEKVILKKYNNFPYKIIYIYNNNYRQKKYLKKNQMFNQSEHL